MLRTLRPELLYDELYARFLFSSLLVLNPFMIQFPLQVYPGVHEQRGRVPPMMIKLIRKNEENTVWFILYQARDGTMSGHSRLLTIRCHDDSS
jgi:hypothetical protein